MSVKRTIYIVEDESHIQQLIKYNLEANGYSVITFSSGEEMLAHCETVIPDMFILDIMLPDMDGYEILGEIRKDSRLSKLPVIMLTAKSEEFDRVLGLELGADDYITKPFSIRELVARVKALFRRSEKPYEIQPEVLTAGDIKIDVERHEVYKGDQKLDLTLKEFELLKILMQNRGKVMTREVLLEKVWGFDYYGETRTVDVHIRYLRQKIENDDSKPEYIETVRGVGYRFI
ncbi:MAG: response regulator transcription factor [Clostridiaceae bacterium]|nr:response regulator transcription factor [Clostridiaceae bacterium]